MMPVAGKPEYFWPVAWGVVAVALVATLGLEHRFGRSAAGEGPRPPARLAEAKLLPPFRLQPDPTAGAQTLERPLFVPSRRPSPPAEGKGGAMKKGQFVLQGTTVVGALSIAFLKEVSTGTVYRAEKGAEIQGMTVAEVGPEQVVLKAGGDAETLILVVAKSAGSGSPGAAVERGPFEPSPAPGAPVPAARGNAPVGAEASAPPGTASATAAGGASAPTSRVPMIGAPPRSAQPATAASPAMTPEEIISRRRAARVQPQN